MQSLIIDYSNFTLEHDLFLVENETGELKEKCMLRRTEIADYIRKNPEIIKVQINALPEFGARMEQEIKKDLALDYANRNIEFEVV